MKSDAAGSDDDLIVERRPPLEPDAVVHADLLVDLRLKQHARQRFRLHELQEVGVRRQPQLLGEIRVDAGRCRGAGRG